MQRSLFYRRSSPRPIFKWFGTKRGVNAKGGDEGVQAHITYRLFKCKLILCVPRRTFARGPNLMPLGDSLHFRLTNWPEMHAMVQAPAAIIYLG